MHASLRLASPRALEATWETDDTDALLTGTASHLKEAYKAGWFELEVVVLSANMQRSEIYEEKRGALLPKRPFVYHVPRRAGDGNKKGTAGRDAVPPVAIKKELSHIRFPEVVMSQNKRERTTLADTSQPSSFGMGKGRLPAT